MTETADSALDVEPYWAAGRALEALSSTGWVVHDAINDIQAVRATHDLTAALAELTPLQPAIGDVEVVGERAGQELRLRNVGGVMEVVSLPSIDPHALFDQGADLENALKAWDRDAKAAQRLPMEWRVTVFLSLKGLVPVDAGFDVQVAVEPGTIVAAFTSASLPNLSRLLPAIGVRRVYLSLHGAARPVHLGAITIASCGSENPVPLPRPAMPLPGEAAVAQHVVGLPGPHSLVPLEHVDRWPTQWEPAGSHCVAAAATATWALLASSVQVAGDRVTLDFLGFKRIRLALPHPAELEPQAVAAGLELRRWALQDASPDRLLAVRQVVSLYEHDDPFRHAQDVQASAEIIYVGLRSDAVAEVVKSSRDAQAQANDTVRQAVKSSQDLVKATTERFLAGLVTAGAIVIANANRNLSDVVSRNLSLLLAGFFGVLALVSAFIEGPLLSLQMKHLATDLRTGSSLLTEQQRQSIVGGPGARATWLRIRIIRVAIPVLYAGLALAIWRWGYPARYR